MPSEIVASSDRRTRKRDQRRDALLDLAAEIVESRGVDGLTMAALAEVSDYAPASLYTYFPSRNALVASLQERALRILGAVGESALERWDALLGKASRPGSARAAKVAALARLWAFSDLFLTAPEHHPKEFRLQQELLASPQSEEGPEDAAVIAAAMAVLDLPRRLLASALEAKALAECREVRNPQGDPVDASMARTLAWVAAMNGTLLLDRLGAGLPVNGLVLGGEVTHSLLHGWGADLTLLGEARAITRDWTAR